MATKPPTTKTETVTTPPGTGVPDNQDHSKPGDNVPAQPGGTPWVPNSPPTGTPAPTGGPSTQRPPGWGVIFMRVLGAYLANPRVSPAQVPDDSILDLAAQLTDRLIARYPTELSQAA